MMLDFEKLFLKEYADLNSENVIKFINNLIGVYTDLNETENLKHILSFKDYINDGKKLCICDIDINIVKYLEKENINCFLYRDKVFIKEDDFDKYKVLLIKYNLELVNKQIYLYENEKNMLNEKLKILRINNKGLTYD